MVGEYIPCMFKKPHIWFNGMVGTEFNFVLILLTGFFVSLEFFFWSSYRSSTGGRFSLTARTGQGPKVHASLKDNPGFLEEYQRLPRWSTLQACAA